MVRVLLRYGAFLLPLVLGTGLSYGQWSIVQLTDNELADTRPDVSGTNIVWQTGTGSWGPELYWYDGQVVCTNGIINNEDAEVFLYESGTAYRVTDNARRDWQPDISGSFVVWSGDDGSDYEIYLYDGSQILQVTDNSYDDAYPAIFGNRIVWQGYDGHDYEIFTAVIPEPAALVVLGAGGLVLLKSRRASGRKSR